MEISVLLLGFVIGLLTSAVVALGFLARELWRRIADLEHQQLLLRQSLTQHGQVLGAAQRRFLDVERRIDQWPLPYPQAVAKLPPAPAAVAKQTALNLPVLSKQGGIKAPPPLGPPPLGPIHWV